MPDLEGPRPPTLNTIGDCLLEIALCNSEIEKEQKKNRKKLGADVRAARAINYWQRRKQRAAERFRALTGSYE